MIGIQETKELLVGVNELSIVMIKQLKDGFQLGQDVMAIVAHWQTDPQFQAAVTSAALGIQNVPAEVKDLNANEIVDLTIVQLQYIPRILEAAKKV